MEKKQRQNNSLTAEICKQENMWNVGKQLHQMPEKKKHTSLLEEC